MDQKNIDVPETDISNTKNPMQILEEALTLCRFGKFHLRLLAASLCSVFASILVTTTSSYILPVAECDLNMNMMYKGLLNAMPFLGQIGASLFTGFLVDAFGRKLFLVGGNTGIFISTLIEGTSQTYWMLMFLKLIQGVALSLCFSAVLTNISEFCPIRMRDKVLLMYAAFMSLAMIVAALMAWVILPLKINFVLWTGYLELHSWNVYLYVTSVWSLMALIIYCSIPESPKFLLSHAQEKEALDVLKTIYNENTGNDKEAFPIKSFSTTGTLKPTIELSLKKQLVNALFEVKELFRRPLIFRLLLFSLISLGGLVAFTSLRLWYPQLSTMVENYNKDHGETAPFCVMINDYMEHSKVSQITSNATEHEICVPKLSGSETYINGIIIGCVSLLFVAVSGIFVDFLGHKLLMFLMLISSTICSLSLYWMSSAIPIAILMSATCGLLQTCISLQQNLFIRVFPTTLRSLAISIIIMVGRIGSLSGNILFPILLEIGCMAPFILIGFISLCIAALTYFLPNVNKENKVTGDK